MTLFIGALFSLASEADIYNRQFLPLGERAAFMANTGTGDPTDTSAVYYNPAGLSGIDKNSISLTGSTYFLFKLNFESGFRIENEPVPYELKGFNTIPSSLVSTVKLGGRTFAFSVLVPDAIDISSRADFRTTNFSGTIIPVSKEQSMWIGLSHAASVGSRWSFGATLWAIYYNQEALSSANIAYQDAANLRISTMERTSVDHYSTSVTLGAHYKLTEKWRWGLRVQTANHEIKSSANFFSQSHVTNLLAAPGSQLSSERRDEKNLDAEYKLPWDLTLGTSYIQSGRLRFLSDVSVQFQSQFQLIPSVSKSARYNTKPVARSSFGVEWKYTDKMPIRLGFAHNPTSLDDFSKNSQGQLAAEIYSVTGGIELQTNANSRSGIGFFVAKGQGRTRDEQGFINRVRIQASGLLLTSSYVF